MNKIGLFFGPVGGNVHQVTKQLAELIGMDKVELVPVAKATANEVEAYSKIIFLSSAIGLDQWDMVDVKDDWDRFFPQLDKVRFNGKTVAVVGLGDHVKYPAHFVGSMATLADKLMDQGAQLTGSVSIDGYHFDHSDALNKDGRFYGLAIDEDNEAELTPVRLKNWVIAIKPAFGL